VTLGFSLAILPATIVLGQECSCGFPCDVVLEYSNIFGIEDHRACLSIVAGPNLRIESSADVTLIAGDIVVLESGFSVLQGGLLTLGIDPLLFCDVTVDGDGDLSNACLDCDDGEPTVYPDASELCDGLDNDCDDVTDEDNPEGGGSCDTGLPGVCAAGTENCVAGSLQCEQNQPPSAEVCDGLDNDCDGTADDGNPGGGGACDTGLLGVCAPGTEMCIAGSLQCEQNQLPTAEVCDGLDNDCDGVVDDGNPGGGGACDTGLPGVCAAGTMMCVEGALQCQQDELPTAEVCDGLDNDCDGTADDGNPGGGGACDTGLLGVCAPGTEMCIAGSLQCQQDQSASPEVCDDLDNDCDGVTDDGVDGDSSNGDIDFPDSWPGALLFEPGYPTYTGGAVQGKILPEGDEDWFAIYAVENLSDFCLTDDQDEPIKAEVNVTPPDSSFWYEVCACWSDAVTLCAKSSQNCATGFGATSTNIYLEMDMQCGATDTGYLDIRVSPDTPALDHSCLEYTVNWNIWE
jgi:hypothetical protein